MNNIIFHTQMKTIILVQKTILHIRVGKLMVVGMFRSHDLHLDTLINEINHKQ